MSAISKRLLAMGMVWLLGMTAALAQQNHTQPTSIDLLITAGYDIKHVMFVPMAALKLMGYFRGTAPQVYITLQKGASTAVCSFTATSWENQAPLSLEDKGRCFAYNLK